MFRFSCFTFFLTILVAGSIQEVCAQPAGDSVHAEFPKIQTNFGNWTVQSYVDQNKAGCLLSGSGQDGTYLTMRAVEMTGSDISLMNSKWTLQSGQSGKIVLGIGGQEYAYDSSVLNTHEIHIDWPLEGDKDSKVLDQLGNNPNTIYLQFANGQKIYYNPQGLNKAVEYFGSCINLLPKPDLQKPDPVWQDPKTGLFWPNGKMPPQNGQMIVLPSDVAPSSNLTSPVTGGQP